MHRKSSLCILFFFIAHALGMWGMNLSNVLKNYGFASLVPYIFAANSVAALLSPLAIGALADRSVRPEKLLRYLGLGAAFFLALFYYAIGERWAWWIVLLLGQIHMLWSIPTFGLTTSLVLSRLEQPREEFGRIRLWATVGWMVAGWMVSWVLQADRSVTSGYASAVAWLLTVSATYLLPPTVRDVPIMKVKRSLREVMGLDALPILKHPQHRVVYFTACLLNIALAAFYPYTALHLDALGVKGTAAALSLGQITEMVAMLMLAWILRRFSFRWVFSVGIGFGVLRYILYMMDVKLAVLVGIFMHGFCFTLFYVSAQIYLEQNIHHEMRVRAQALMTFLISGVGNLIGSLGSGFWHSYVQRYGLREWSWFWGGMLVLTLITWIYFLWNYRDTTINTEKVDRKQALRLD